MTFDKLSNEEIVYIHMLMDDIYTSMNEVLDNGGITYVMDSPLGKVELFGQFSEDELKELKQSPKVVLAASILDKLEPVYDLIAESNGDIIDNVRKSLFPKRDIEDGEDENL